MSDKPEKSAKSIYGGVGYDLTSLPSGLSEKLNEPDIVFHYTSLSTAIEKILFEGKLKVSPKTNAGDPFEGRMEGLYTARLLV